MDGIKPHGSDMYVYLKAYTTTTVSYLHVQTLKGTYKLLQNYIILL